MEIKTKPKGRVEVRRALIQAAATLLSRHGINAVSVRDIAKEAGVNHGLIHRHFGSKKALVTFTIQSLAKDVIQQIGPGLNDEKLIDLLKRSFLTLRGNRKYWRILAHLMLIDEGKEMLQSDFPFVKQLILSMQNNSKPSNLSPQSMVVLILAVGFGMMIFRPYLQRAVEVDDEGWKKIQLEIMQWAFSFSN